MNHTNLERIFSRYMEQFERMNNKDCDESFKWVVAQRFREEFNLDVEDLSGMLLDLQKKSRIQIDNSREHGFHALGLYAKQEPETVRKLLRELLSEDGGDLKLRQKRIIGLIAETERLRMKYYPEMWMYKMNQHTVMTLLAMIRPEEDYIYKYTQAREFADCIGFMDDWGCGASMQLDIYYRMCDALVCEIRKNDALMRTHLSRYETDTRKLHPDTNLHILAFDIIYCCGVHGLFSGISYDHPDYKERKLLVEHRKKAQELLETLETAQADFDTCAEAGKLLADGLCTGTDCLHRTYGKGIVESCNIETGVIEVRFAVKNEKRMLGIAGSLGNGLLKIGDGSFNRWYLENKGLLGRSRQLSDAVKKAYEAYAPYEQYLE